MGWLKKQFWTKGPGSPGATARVIAESYLTGRNNGLSDIDICQRVLSDYFDSFMGQGILNPNEVPRGIENALRGDPAITTLYVVYMSLKNKPAALHQIVKEIEVVTEIIVSEQNKILNENKTVSDVNAIFPIHRLMA